MKKADVKVGGTYAAKVSGKVVPVRIDAENPRGGWDATNTATGKKVRIKSARRLRGAVRKAKASKPHACGQGLKPEHLQVGHVYSVKLNGPTGGAQPVLITEQTKDGWKGEVVGLAKPQAVTITDPKRVRRHCKSLPAKYGMPSAQAAARAGEAKAARGAPDATRAKGGREGASQTGAKAAKKAKTPREKRPSLLDLAAEVLAKAKEPMDCKAIVEKVLASGRWQTKGKTPAATLYSAIIREVAKKPKDTRFKKVGRGTFAHAGKEA